MSRTFRCTDIGQLYRSVIHDVLEYGNPRSARGMLTTEITNAQIVLSNPLASRLMTPERNLNQAFACGEFIWMLSGSEDVEMISYYNNNMRRYSDDGKVLAGAYGPRIMRQIEYVIETLKKDPDSRQAVLTIWTENPAPSKDIPCTVMMHFMVNHERRLNLTVYMRSNDVLLGLPYDISSFTLFQNLVSNCLGIPVGVYVHNVGSLHIYDNDRERLRKILYAKPVYELWPEKMLGIKETNDLRYVRDTLAVMEKAIRLGIPIRPCKKAWNVECEMQQILMAWKEKKDARKNNS